LFIGALSYIATSVSKCVRSMACGRFVSGIQKDSEF